jgi:hypothetical protein
MPPTTSAYENSTASRFATGPRLIDLDAYPSCTVKTSQSSLRRKRFSAAKCAARPGIEHEETDKIAGDEGERGGAV